MKMLPSDCRQCAVVSKNDLQLLVARLFAGIVLTDHSFLMFLQNLARFFDCETVIDDVL